MDRYLGVELGVGAQNPVHLRMLQRGAGSGESLMDLKQPRTWPQRESCTPCPTQGNPTGSTTQ